MVSSVKRKKRPRDAADKFLRWMWIVVLTFVGFWVAVGLGMATYAMVFGIPVIG